MAQLFFDPEVDNWKTECDEICFLWHPTFDPQPFFLFLSFPQIVVNVYECMIPVGWGSCPL